MLRILEQSGLIDRQSAADDLRRLNIKLSEKGLETVNRLGPQIEGIYQDLTHSIGPDLLQSLYQNVDEMITRVQGSPPRI